jgi:hypothetical protein
VPFTLATTTSHLVWIRDSAESVGQGLVTNAAPLCRNVIVAEQEESPSGATHSVFNSELLIAPLAATRKGGGATGGCHGTCLPNVPCR